MDKLKDFIRLIDWVSEKEAVIGSSLTLVMMALVVYEVSARYLANSPTIWSMELCQFAFTYIIALGGAYTLRTNGHVSVDILYSRFGKRTQAIIGIFTTIIVIIFLILLAYQTGVMSIEALTENEHTGTAFNPPTFPAKVVIPIGVSVFILQAIVTLIKYIIQAATGENPEEQIGKEKF